MPTLTAPYKAPSFRALCDEASDAIKEANEEIHFHLSHGCDENPEYASLLIALREAHDENVLESAVHYIHQAEELATAQRECRADYVQAWDDEEVEEGKAIIRAIRTVALGIDAWFYRED